MGRAAAARRSIRRPTARPSQRPQAVTDPLDPATETPIRPQALRTRQTSTSRPRIEASAQNEIAFGSGVVARRPPHSLNASPKPPTASRWAPAPPTTPLRHLQRPRDGGNVVCAPSPIGAAAHAARDRSGGATTALGRSLDIVTTLLGAGEQRRGREERRTRVRGDFDDSNARAVACLGASKGKECLTDLDGGECEAGE